LSLQNHTIRLFTQAQRGFLLFLMVNQGGLPPQKIPLFAGNRLAGHDGRDCVFYPDRGLQD